MGCFEDWVAVGGNISVALVVGEKEEDVGSFSFEGRCGRRGSKQHEKACEGEESAECHKIFFANLLRCISGCVWECWIILRPASLVRSTS